MQENRRFPGLPVGCKFCPTDKELLGYFLYTKVNRMALPPQYDTLIRECDLYGELEPWQIWEIYRGDVCDKDDDDDEKEEEEVEEDMFFFTQLKKKSVNGSRINRKVGCSGGAWQSEDAAKKVSGGKSAEPSRKLGFKKRFRYENKDNPEHDRAWIMHEYSLDPSLLKSRQINDYVVCRIKKNVNVGKNNRKRQVEQQQVMINAKDSHEIYEAIDYGDSQSQSLAVIKTNFWNYDGPQLF